MLTRVTILATVLIFGVMLAVGLDPNGRMFQVVAAPIDTQQAQEFGSSGLPLPRFVSLGSDEVNMRTGPGERYPVDWIYVREGFPVKVIAEYGPWRKIEDQDGTEGWVHGNLLSGQRTGFVQGRTRTLFDRPDSSGNAVMRVEEGVVGRIVMCEGAWCQMLIDKRRGWVLRDHIWGALQAENFN